jgi:hypothetical protein
MKTLRTCPKIGRADDLTGKDYYLYRAFEILPGLLSWGTLIGCILLSFFAPVIAAFFIIVFDLYWLAKTVYLSAHLRYNWRRIRHNIKTDWRERLEHIKYDHVWHMVLLPYSSESYETVRDAIEGVLTADYDHKKMMIVLAREERYEASEEISTRVKSEFGDRFGYFFTAAHPSGVPGEQAGKGANCTYAIEEARKEILDVNNILYEDVMVSALDIDTVVYPQYFLVVTWHFLTAENPYKASYQPVPFYNNNVWEAPMLSRVVATSSTFWQMIQQERPEKLSTFSSHSVPFKSLYEIGYWQVNMVSEDSRIYWNLYMAHLGDYRVIPISYPVSMDANLAPGFWKTVKNMYKQYRRWAWGVENVPYILYGLVKNKNIPFWKKVRTALVQLEGFWSLATNTLIIFLLGWLPLWIGGLEFNQTILSYNLPIVTRNLMILAMLGLVLSAVISMTFLPARPKHQGRYKYFFMFFQWILVPITITVFGAIPGLDAQTRLMFGKYMGFWVTTKHRSDIK